MKKIFATALLFAALTQASFAASVYNRGGSAEPQTLDPHKVSLIQEANIAYDLFEGLVTYDVKSDLIPGVAESWTISPDGKTYTFKLRENAKWSDGSALTADDFVYAWQRVANPKTGSYYASMLFPVKNGEAIAKGTMQPDALGVRAVDAHTFEVTLNNATPYFMETLAYPATYPVPKAVVEKLGPEWVKPNNMVSNGAFILKDFIPKDKVQLVKNPNYRDAPSVAFDELNYMSLEDRATAMKRFEAGEIDSYDDVPAEQLDHVKQTIGDQFLTGPYLGTYYFWFKNDKKPFDNAKLRRAISLMVDREYIADKIWGGTMVAGYSLVPPGIKGYEPVEADFKNMTAIEREDEAKKLMAELGHGPDKPLKLELRFNTSENHRNTAVAVTDMLKPFGIEASLLNADAKTHYGILRGHGDFDMARANWVGDYRDPQTFLLIGVTDDGHNYGLYSNKDYDKLVAEASVEIDVAKRREIMRKAEAMIVADQPMLILLHYRSKSLVSKQLKGWETNIMDTHLTRWMSKN
ncbi:MAG: peptide ABC transporter substrate-binding protein [Pseudomonadota bacterium]